MINLFKKQKETPSINSMTGIDLFHYHLDKRSRHWICRHYGCTRKELHSKIYSLWEEFEKEKTL